MVDILVGGMPRSGTTLAAKFLSLHSDIFCYAGETHLIPFMYGMMKHYPCLPEKQEAVLVLAAQNLQSALVDMPRYSVSRGAHPGNLIFDESDVAGVVGALRGILREGLTGEQLYASLREEMRHLISRRSPRQYVGEKTPSNIFVMAEEERHHGTLNLSVVREPFGVVESMEARVGNDPYADAFSGTIEHQIGIYISYGEAVARAGRNGCGMLVRYEDMAKEPARVVERMFGHFGKTPEARVLDFVEGAPDPDIAGRAPMHYRRLAVKPISGKKSPLELWKILTLTGAVRGMFGYDDAYMRSLGAPERPVWPKEVAVHDCVIPLFGLSRVTNGLSRFSETWRMEQDARLIAYVSKVADQRIILDIERVAPDGMDWAEARLTACLGGEVALVAPLGEGKKCSKMEIPVRRDQISPIEGAGGFILIDLHSSHAYSPLAHTVQGQDHRPCSAIIRGMRVKKKGFWR